MNRSSLAIGLIFKGIFFPKRLILILKKPGEERKFYKLK
jgi:hypothetical protein